MSIEDFNNINNNDSVEEKNSNVEVKINDINIEDIKYYIVNMDELINLLHDSYTDYVNAKLNYEFEKHNLQLTIDWNKENKLREEHNLSKISNQTQRDSLINVKVKDSYVNMKSCESKYKLYEKIFNFIDKNYILLYDSVKVGCNCVSKDVID